MNARPYAVLAGLVALALSSPLLAAPTLWQRAKDPRARAEAKMLATLERSTDDARRLGMFELGGSSHFANGLVAMIELERLTEPNDPALACAVAKALVDANDGREAQARRLLERALERMPPGSRAAEAWWTLARALGALDDPKAEHHAYSRVIELTLDSETRAVAYYNRGEVSMRFRELERARADYEKAVLGAYEPALLALSRYGLAVAQERLGDLHAAYQTFDRAQSTLSRIAEDPLDLPGTVFIPAYEEHYIRALRAMAAARNLTDPDEQRYTYEAAGVEWDHYLARAPDDEPFRENARSHRARVDRALAAIPPTERPVPRGRPQRAPKKR